MAYVEQKGDSTPTVKLTLTNVGKKSGFEVGFLNIFKYFTISDSDIIYTLDVSPNNLPDVNGEHETSTGVSSGSIINLKQQQ